MSALNDASLILPSAEFATREHIDRYCRQNDLRPQVLMEVNSISAAIEVIQRTRLSTLLPPTVARGRDDLAAVALDPLPLQRTAVLMQRKGAPTERPLRAPLSRSLWM
ncbi:LysR substrate-binding domain-containing protein [Burkholderia ubonensis]|uniref:LysR substrate-binding domain-containing protein n=1 Tax=Burkholderia ubonensis TaxID=101571 RepID=UPI0039F5A22B